MKKKVLAAVLVGVLCLGLFVMTGCGDKVPYSDYDLTEYVTVGEYKGLEYEMTSVSVSDDEVDTEIQSRLESKATTEEVKSGTVEEGDQIVIGYEGRIDGETFDGGSSDEYEMTVGQANFIDGFEDGLIGKNVGDTVTLDLEFPEDYHEESLAGKPDVFEVNIKTKKVQNVPEYNLEFVEENSDYDNFEDYEASVKKDLLAEKETDAENEMKTQLWKQIMDSSEIKKYPEEKDEAIADEQERLKQEASDSGVSYEDYLSSSGYSAEQMEELLKTFYENKFFEEMVLYAIADKEGIEVTEKEYKKQLDELLESSGMDENTFEDAYQMTIEEWADSRSIRSTMLLNKVMDKVMEYGTEK